MKPIIFIASIIILFISQSSAQDFKTTFFAESKGQVDSVVIGYDNTASIEVDS